MTSFYVTALMDPNQIRQGQWSKEPAQQLYLDRLVEREKAGDPPIQWDTTKPPPGSLLYPSIPQLRQWWTDFKKEGYNAISHDLETAGQFIICDGLTPLNLDTGKVGPSLCLRFRGHGGVRWWNSFTKHTEAANWLGKVLADPEVSFVGHNVVGFDIPILLEHGFEINGPICDTMVLMSRAYPEMRKGLGYCATLFCGAPAWKLAIKVEDDAPDKS